MRCVRVFQNWGCVAYMYFKFGKVVRTRISGLANVSIRVFRNVPIRRFQNLGTRNSDSMLNTIYLFQLFVQKHAPYEEVMFPYAAFRPRTRISDCYNIRRTWISKCHNRLHADLNLWHHTMYVDFKLLARHCTWISNYYIVSTIGTPL